MIKQLEPKPIRVLNGNEAWVYRNNKSIDVCIYANGFGTLVARITDKQLTKLINSELDQEVSR